MQKLPEQPDFNRKVKEIEEMIKMLFFHKQTLEQNIKILDNSLKGNIISSTSGRDKIKARKELFNDFMELNSVINNINAKNRYLQELKQRVKEQEEKDKSEGTEAKENTDNLIKKAKVLLLNTAVPEENKKRLKEYINDYKPRNQVKKDIVTFYLKLKSEIQICNNILKN